MKRMILLTIAMTLSLLIGCDKGADKAATTEPTAEPAAEAKQDAPAKAEENHDGHDHAAEGDEHAGGHAPAGYEPGSHDDWCGGHQVPESMCTRCNPTLIAGFKATGDWCDEHKMPKSQCLACDPNLKIERPAKKVAQ